MQALIEALLSESSFSQKITKGFARKAAKRLDKHWAVTGVKSLKDIRSAAAGGVLAGMSMRDRIDNQDAVKKWAASLSREDLNKLFRMIEEIKNPGSSRKVSRRSEDSLAKLKESLDEAATKRLTLKKAEAIAKSLPYKDFDLRSRGNRNQWSIYYPDSYVKGADAFLKAALAKGYAVSMLRMDTVVPGKVSRRSAMIDQLGYVESLDEETVELNESTLTQPAKDALQVIGGMRALRMIGASQIRDLSTGSASGKRRKGVGIKWPNKKRSKGNYFELYVNGLDEYILEFWNVSRSGSKKVKTFGSSSQGLPLENIVSVFEKYTGWYLRM